MTERLAMPFVPKFGVRARLEQAPGTTPAPQFEIQYHAEMTIEACPDDPTMRDNLSTIVAANVATDLDQFDSTLHFDNCVFALGAQRIADLWALIESKIIEENPYVLFGTMTHTVQDFYAHSNWVELNEAVSPIPVWDLNVATLPPKIVSGVFWLDTPQLCAPGAPTHAKLNKDSPTSEEGSKVVQSGPNANKNLFELAYAAALAATRVQFARLARLKP